MAVTKSLKDALVADCESITVANGFENTIGDVATDPEDATALALPALVIEGLADGEDDPATFGARMANATQRFTVVGLIRGDESGAALESLLDDLRNAVGRPTSNLKTALTSGNKVQHAIVSGWDEDEGSPRLKNEVHRFSAVVEVSYYYVRGSL